MPRRSSKPENEAYEAKWGHRRAALQRELVEQATAQKGYAVCGEFLSPERVCSMPPGHKGNHG